MGQGPEDVDGLLKDYLAPNAKATEKADEKAAAASKPVASGALKKLLNRYLETNASKKDAGFAKPRSGKVDDLLRRYMEDREDVEGDLADRLREHLDDEDREEADRLDNGILTSATSTSSGSDWARQTASYIHGIGSLDDRLAGYVEAVVREEEAAHAFKDDDESTIRGVPAGGGGPVPLGSEKANRIKGESGPHRTMKKKP